MSFQIITQGRRPRGLGGPFTSVMFERAGEAIGIAVSSGRAASTPSIEGTRSETFTDTDSEGRLPDAPDFGGRPPVTTDVPDEGGGGGDGELDCGCLAKRAHEALVNLGMTEEQTGTVADIQAECEGDPDLFYTAVSGFFPDGAIPSCAWYETPGTRNKVLAIGAGVLVLGGLGLYAVRRRRR